jgi:hypothetical protein
MLAVRLHRAPRAGSVVAEEASLLSVISFRAREKSVAVDVGCGPLAAAHLGLIVGSAVQNSSNAATLSGGKTVGHYRLAGGGRSFAAMTL